MSKQVFSFFRAAIMLLSVLSFGCQSAIGQVAADAGKFTNPLLSSGPDPWVITWKGFYYYMNTTSESLTLWKTRDIADLRDAEKKVVWRPEAGKPWSHGTWAPELYRWGSKWYIYFAADEGKNESHRIYVVENSSDDPMQGEWTFKGKVSDSTDRWAIDADVFEVNGKHYMLWSGWKGEQNGEQDIFIARMSNPWTIDSPRTLLSAPTYDWERIDGRPHAAHVDVNEGPEALIHAGKVLVVYSGSGCWTDAYELGVLETSTGANLLDPASWRKYDHPFFKQDPKAGVYATGHNGFFRSLDGKQDWIIYHANSAPGQGCGGTRSPRMQPFTWNPDGTPNFGTPIPADQMLDKPGR
jgi:GH43 family beta-xylosidase